MDTPKTGGEEEMENEYRKTTEEEAYDWLLEKSRAGLSGAARTVLGNAQSTAYSWNLSYPWDFQPEDYDEAMTAMREAASELTDQDCKLLARIWRAALGAAASVDPDDKTPFAYHVSRGYVHAYYRMVSGMVEKTLKEKTFEERRREAAEREPTDPDEIPY